MNTKILDTLTTRNEIGKHFTEVYTADELTELEESGYILIHRPLHPQTGIRYDQQYWSVELTENGIAEVMSDQ